MRAVSHLISIPGFIMTSPLLQQAASSLDHYAHQHKETSLPICNINFFGVFSKYIIATALLYAILIFRPIISVKICQWHVLLLWQHEPYLSSPDCQGHVWLLWQHEPYLSSPRLSRTCLAAMAI